MKILVLAPRPLWPVHDGGTVATARCINGLAKAGAIISVLSMVTEKHSFSPHPTHSEAAPNHSINYRAVQVSTKISSKALIRNLLLSDKPYDLERFRSVAYAEALRETLEREEFDLIHCEGLAMSVYLEEIRKLTTTPVALRAHNIEHRIREMMAENDNSSLRRAYLRNLSHRLKSLETKRARQFDAIVPISETDFSWFLAVAEGKPVFLCETGTEEIEYLPEPASDNPRVGFIGAMNWQPNIDGIRWFISRVWPELCKRVPGVTLHLAGRGILEHLTGLPQGSGIFTAGEPEDARKFIASNHVMISPLFAGSGLRIKIVEAMSAGRPVVATPVAAEGMPVEKGREMAIAADEASFCNDLASLLQQPGLRSAMAKAALKKVHERFDNRSNTTRLLEFYKILAHGR